MRTAKILIIGLVLGCFAGIAGARVAAPAASAPGAAGGNRQPPVVTPPPANPQQPASATGAAK